MKSEYKVIGVMAGSSMDGLDVAEVLFVKENKWTFECTRSQSFIYTSEIRDALIKATNENKDEQEKVDYQFGEWIADRLLDFKIDDIDLISVHGHTIVHKPAEGVSWQLGDGRVIANKTGVNVATDFRSLDVSLGGQGAPLVPVGDFQLFDEYDACLNLGGIANISVRDIKMAWDICPCNQVLNYFARKLGKEFDENGELGRTGSIHKGWREHVLENSFYSQTPPKSLPNQFIATEILDDIIPLDGLRTFTEFIAEKIIDEVDPFLDSGSQILTTGGGAFNGFLTDLLNDNGKGFEFQVPDAQLVAYKEAIVFGLLGILKMRDEPNVLASVTGALRDTSSGVIHSPK